MLLYFRLVLVLNGALNNTLNITSLCEGEDKDDKDKDEDVDQITNKNTIGITIRIGTRIDLGDVCYDGWTMV